MDYWRPIPVCSASVAGAERVDLAGKDNLSAEMIALAGMENVGFSVVERLQRDVGRVDYQVVSVTEMLADHATELEVLSSARADIGQLGLHQPQIMGILNVTPDSFFDGGTLTHVDDAVLRALKMVEQGASIIDIGGESTRPGAEVVSIEEELGRVIPVIEKLRSETNALISIDTRKAAVMTAAVQAGASMINDVSALSFDDAALKAAALADVPVVLMHALGTPQTMQQAPHYEHVLLDVYDYLGERIEAAVEAGIARNKLVVDPGIGFGKTLAHNAVLMQGLSLFHGYGVPVLLGCSRKSFIAGLSRGEEAKDRLAGSLAGALKGAAQGCQILRVHDVAETAQALAVWQLK